MDLERLETKKRIEVEKTMEQKRNVKFETLHTEKE